ncbi:Tropomyosin [Popillia japonica]|uniref:Tropomyosin n=1 Tax=Popillia japonica TaxID=7064 RepID=A0AAW1L689_POPJA
MRHLLRFSNTNIYCPCFAIAMQMNLVSTKTDTSLWPTRWTPHSLNWPVIKSKAPKQEEKTPLIFILFIA